MAKSTVVALYTTGILQLLASFEKQIFDFLGYMWLPILGNFLNIVFTIFCLFGIWQKRSNYIVSYLVWSVVWIGWNAFTVCYYLEAGVLRTTDDVLSLGTHSFSWWLANGYGCNPEYFQNVSSVEETSPQIYYPIRPGKVTGCLVDYQWIEVAHAGVHLVLALCGLALGCIFVVDLQAEERRAEHSKSIYSIEYSPQMDDLQQQGGQETQLYANSDEVRPHMTPRRVKRRSYTRSSARSAGYNSGKSSLSNRTRRSSTRSVGGGARNKSVNPVTRLIANGPLPPPPNATVPHDSSSTSNDDSRLTAEYGQVNPAYESSRPNSVYSSASRAITAAEQSRPPSALTSYSNFHGQRKAPAVGNLGMTNVTNLTQDTFLKAPPAETNGRMLMNSSFDDLPPPPPPLSPIDDPLHMGGAAAAQVPVPQQRHVSRKNEYVNMPIQPASSSSYGDQNSLFSNDDAQTLRAHGHYLRQQPAAEEARFTNGHAQSNGGAIPRTYNYSSQQQQQMQHLQKPQQRLSAATTNGSEDDYGFSAGPLLPPKQQPQPQSAAAAAADNDKWYLKDSMRPVGANVHGGNCKCYRCQRKLTAI